MKYVIPILALVFFTACSDNRTLPILGERTPVEKLVNGKTVIDTLYQTIPPFSYLNQDSIFVTDKDFDGKIYVADFFFTACNTICPVMHRNMLDVYNKFRNDQRVKILSHSIDVKYDLPSRLKAYANKLGVESDKWAFVHGSRDSIFNVAAKSYLVAAYEDDADPQGLVHQGWFVLVDTQKRLRGAYDGTQEDQVKQLLDDIQVLLKESDAGKK